MHKNKISKEDFLKLNEKDLMFITNPGRMGDEDGSTFVIKNGNKFSVYRISGWMYPKVGEKEEYRITMEDTAKHFPKWYETLRNCNDKNYKGKYKHFYMGFGNGLCIDNTIYSEFEPYLNSLVEKYLEEYSEDEKKSLKYVAIYNVWEQALTNMAKDNNYVFYIER